MPRPEILEDPAYWDSFTLSRTIRPYLYVRITFLHNPTVIFEDIMDPWVSGSSDNAGLLQSITFPEENIHNEKQTFTITLSGLDPSLLAHCLAATHTSAIGAVDLGFRNEAMDDWFEHRVADGLLDTCSIVESEEGTLINMQFAQSGNWMWDRPMEGRYTDAYQKTLLSRNESPLGQSFSADRGFEFVEQLQNWELFWAKPKPAKKKGKKHKNKKNHGKS